MKKIITAFVLITILFAFCACNITNSSAITQIKEYAKSNSSFNFSDAINFSWDVAYIDRQLYSYADDIKEKYDLTFDVEMLDTDHTHRILFFKDGKLVQQPRYEFMRVKFPEDLEVIAPDTIFEVRWEYPNEDNLEYSVLIFTVVLKN